MEKWLASAIMNEKLKKEAIIANIETGVFVGVEKIKPKKIIQNGIATIVFWNDDTKTVVKLADGEENDIFTAFCVAFTKRLFGSTSAINRQIEKTFQPSKKEIEAYNEVLKRITKFFNSFNLGKND